MNSFTPNEMVERYLDITVNKTKYPIWKLFLLGIFGGFLVGIGCVAANIVTHAIDNPSISRLVSGVIFAFGLGMIMISGAELFTGNCMMPLAMFEDRIGPEDVIKNWIFVYSGNIIGGLLLAFGVVKAGVLNYNNPEVAIYAMKIAQTKITLGLHEPFILGMLCNILVCLAVLISLSATDTFGRMFGAYVPVLFFVLCGFEHSVANMFYIPVGIMASRIPEFADVAMKSGIQLTDLNVFNYIFANLVPVTAGNLLGGLIIGLIMFTRHHHHNRIGKKVSKN